MKKTRTKPNWQKAIAKVQKGDRALQRHTDKQKIRISSLLQTTHNTMMKMADNDTFFKGQLLARKREIERLETRVFMAEEAGLSDEMLQKLSKIVVDTIRNLEVDEQDEALATVEASVLDGLYRTINNALRIGDQRWRSLLRVVTEFDDKASQRLRTINYDADDGRQGFKDWLDMVCAKKLSSDPVFRNHLKLLLLEKAHNAKTDIKGLAADSEDGPDPVTVLYQSAARGESLPRRW